MAEILISLLHNHIINMVRSYRLELDISQQVLSKKITKYSETNLVGLIESSKTPTTYNDSHLNIIVKEFSKMALSQGKEKIDYTIFDLYPKVAVPEKMIVKTIDTIPKNIQATGTLNLLIENNDSFFNEWHNVKEITAYCNQYMKREWKTTDFTSVIVRAETKKKLMRSGENEALYKKS
ncbi:hypothetical protein ABDD95_20175 [Mucilaginibacter sp. PAMB04274]|uniref:hypothetical protein n=1 Tax=Mucilaginibacter sp. PAMB04274 TaxID=3138568 RepID=UPI0031F61E9B